jgi:Fe-S-cluster containining protein
MFHSVCRDCNAYCCTLILPPLTNKEREQILKAGFPDHFEKIQKDLYIIKPGSTSKCPYLTEDYSCSIHMVKPHLCALWPVIPSYKDKKRGCVIVQCPLFPFLPKEAIDSTVREAAHIPLHIIEHLWNISSEAKEKYKRFEYRRI